MIDITAYCSKDGLSLDRLGTLCRFVDAGGLSAAAGKDHARVSLYSRQIRELGEFFGVPLARRVGRTSVPTEAAVRLATLVREHIAAMDDFAAKERRAPQRVVVAAAHSVLEWWVVPRLAAIRKALPDGASIVLSDMRSLDVAEAVETRRADLGLIRSDAILPEGLKRQAVTGLGYALFVPAKRVRGKNVLELLEALPLAVSMGGQFRRQLDEHASKAGLKIHIAVECSSFALAAAAVESGYAAILPETAASRFPDHRVVRLPLPFKGLPARNLVAIWPVGMTSPWLGAIREAIR
jgi:DNA-binding transcriptional LysR family regulator